MFYLADAATGTAGSAGIGSVFNMIWPFIAMFAVFYFLLIRPQQKKQKSRAAMLSSIKKGDKVVTVGGLHGTILELTDDIVVLKVNDATKLTFDRSSISSIASDAESSGSGGTVR